MKPQRRVLVFERGRNALVERGSIRRAVLFRTEHAVPGVAQAGDDVAVLIELLVDRGGPDLDVGMGFGQPLDPFGRGEKADEPDILHPAPLEAVDGGDRRIGGRKHRIHHDHQPIGDIGRGLEVIFDRLEGLRVAIEADVGDPRARDEIEHPIEKTNACAQNGREHQLLAGDRGAIILASGVSTSTISSGRSRVTS